MALKDCKVDLKAKTITIILDLETPTPSASGKTMVVASTRGNARTTASVGGHEITVGVNAYYSNK